MLERPSPFVQPLIPISMQANGGRRLLQPHLILTRKQPALEKEFEHFQKGRIAVECRDSDEFTQFDGLVPEAGTELDPTKEDSKRTSPSRLEAFGSCPRKFFFRYGLGIYPPDEHEVDHERWLDALQLGSLLHEVFEDFLRELTKQDRIPELARDHASLLALLHEKTDVLQQTIPVPNQDAFERQLQRLEKTCEIFLRNEEEHCRSTGSVPWILEASIGLGDDPVSQVDVPEPVALSLSDGRAIKVGGRIDRIDQIGGDGSPGNLRFGITSLDPLGASMRAIRSSKAASCNPSSMRGCCDIV